MKYIYVVFSMGEVYIYIYIYIYYIYAVFSMGEVYIYSGVLQCVYIN